MQRGVRDGLPLAMRPNTMSAELRLSGKRKEMKWKNKYME